MNLLDLLSRGKPILNAVGDKGGETLSAFASIKMMWVKSRPVKVSGNLDSSWLWVPNLWALMLQPSSSRPEATSLSPLVILSWWGSHCPPAQGGCWRYTLERRCSRAEQMDGQTDGRRGRWHKAAHPGPAAIGEQVLAWARPGSQLPPGFSSGDICPCPCSVTAGTWLQHHCGFSGPLRVIMKSKTRQYKPTKYVNRKS